MGHTAIRRIERVFTCLAVLARLLIAAEEEDRVVGARRNSQRDQQVDGECREPDELVVAEKRDYPSGRGQFDEDRDQQEHHRHHRAVDQQQHGEDHQHRHDRDLDQRAVATVVHVRHQRRGTGHVRRDALGRGRPVDDVADRCDRLLRQRGALIAGQVELNVNGFAVRTLSTRRRERIAPEVLHMLDVGRVGAQLLDDAVVVMVGVVAELAVAFQNKHREVVGVGLLELLAHDLHGLYRRRVLGAQGNLAFFGDLLQRRNCHGHQDDDAQPREDDQHRESADQPRSSWPRGVFRVGRLPTHAPLRTQ